MNEKYIILFNLSVFTIMVNCYRIRLSKSTKQTVTQGNILYDKPIERNVIASSMPECAAMCGENDICITFFFNIKTYECVPYATHLLFPVASSPGWTYYVSRDGTDRCPTSFLLYRAMDFCYKTIGPQTIQFNNFKSNCAAFGGNLAPITSQQRHQYFKGVLGSTGDQRNSLCLAGKKEIQSNTWKLDDGSDLTYFNWAPFQPSNGACLVYQQDQWRTSHCTNYYSKCWYLCER